MADPKVVRAIIRIGKRRGVPAKHIKSALATGIVESGLRNLGGGDADSAGWRQERASLYKNPTNINASVNRYYNETKQHDHGQSSAQLSADVQRPAAQYRGRYGESSVQHQAAQLLKSGGGGGSGGGSGGRSRTRTTGFTPQTTTVSQEQTFDKAGYEQAKRSALVGQMLAKRHGTGGILFKSGLLSTELPSQAEFQDTKLVTKTDPGTRPRQRVSGGSAGGRAAGGGKPLKGGKVIGTPHSGTHTLGNWQSDNAVDISIPNGRRVFAVGDGEVVKVKGSYSGGASRFDGYQVTIKTRNNQVFYTHLSRASVKAGQKIKRGQTIGRSGSANGVPHLHMGVEKGDPRDYLKHG